MFHLGKASKLALLSTYTKFLRMGKSIRRKLLLQVTYHPLLTRINSLLRKSGKGLSGRDALDDAFIVTDNNILSPEGFFFKHPTLCKIKPFLYLLTKFQYFFLRHMISFV